MRRIYQTLKKFSYSVLKIQTDIQFYVFPYTSARHSMVLLFGLCAMEYRIEHQGFVQIPAKRLNRILCQLESSQNLDLQRVAWLWYDLMTGRAKG